MREFMREFVEKNAWTEGKYLRYLKEVKGLTIDELAEKSDCTDTTIKRYMNDTTEINDKRAKKIADALNISVEELKSKAVRLERGIEEKKEKVLERAKEIASASNKSVKELIIQDIKSEEGFEDRMAKILIDIYHKKNLPGHDVKGQYIEKLFSQAQKNHNDYNIFSLIADLETQFLQIYDYDWAFIQCFLELDDSDIIWIKEIIFDYLICSEIFVHNINLYNKYLHSIKNALNNSEYTYKNIEKMMKDLNNFLKENNIIEKIKFMENITEIIWDMVMFFAKLNDYVAGDAFGNEQCLVNDCMQKLIEKS